MMREPADGQVHKVIRLVATSPSSWEDAARNGVQEAAKTIVDLRSAKVSNLDTVVEEGRVRQYRVKLEMVFQLDRSRRRAGTAEVVHVRRYLIVANQTLVSHALHELVDERVASGPAEFHILAPQAAPTMAAQIIDRAPSSLVSRRRRDSGAGHDEAEERLRLFLHAFSRLGDALTGEVGDPDPVAAVRTVLERGSFDEIIVSTLPPKRSRWTMRGVIANLERSVPVPVTALVHDEGDELASCPIG